MKLMRGDMGTWREVLVAFDLTARNAGGAAAVFAATLAIAQLKLSYVIVYLQPTPSLTIPSVNLVTVVPLTENMPGPSATKPGDMCVFCGLYLCSLT
jgi:hypothetical protein